MATIHIRNGVEYAPVNTVIPLRLKQKAQEAGIKFTPLLVEAIEQKLSEATA